MSVDERPLSHASLVAIPSQGRLRQAVHELVVSAGFSTSSGGPPDGRRPTWLDMRPRDAAAWLAAGRIGGAFLSTDIAHEYELEDWPAVRLKVARSTLVIAVRDDDPRDDIAELSGATIATHLPTATRHFLHRVGVDATIIPMGGSLEGVCAAGLADAIVDLRETGQSLMRYGLRTLAEIGPCMALFVHPPGPVAEVDDLARRLAAVVTARQYRYVMFHAPQAVLADVAQAFHGLAAPTVLPLVGRDDIVAVHVTIAPERLWATTVALEELGCSGIVVLSPEVMIP